jgi:hypothetical protein
VKRLRIAFWELVFQRCVKLTNWALVRRSRACGCPACIHVAHLTVMMARGPVGLVKPSPRAHAGGGLN